MTYPEPGTALARFGLVTDMHMADKDPVGDRNYRDADEKLTDAVTVFNADGNLNFVMMLGDFVEDYDGENREQTLVDLAQIEAVYDDLTMPRYYVHGANHGPRDLTKAELIANTGATDMYYSFDVGNLHVVVLDAAYYADDDNAHYDPATWASDPWLFVEIYVPPGQRTWLESDLAATAKDTIVCLHFRMHPDRQDGYTVYNTADVKAILEASGKVRHVLSGHHHRNAHAIDADIGYHVFEAMTEEPYPANSYGIVTIYDNGWIAVDGLETRQETYSLGVKVCG